MNSCSECAREFEYQRAKGHRKNVCNTCIVNRRREKITSKIREYKGSKCECCGYSKCWSALEFHHRDMSQKDFQISGNWGLSWDRIKKELDKCVLVCANCHREVHASLIAL